MRLIFTTAIMLCAAPVFAQQASPVEQALGAKLSQEINAGLICNTSLIDLQRQLAEARKQIEELRKPAQPPQ